MNSKRSPYSAWGVYDMRPVPLRGMGDEDWITVQQPSSGGASPQIVESMVDVLRSIYPKAFSTSAVSFNSMIATLTQAPQVMPPLDCSAVNPAVRLCCKMADLYRYGVTRANGGLLMRGLAARLKSQNADFVKYGAGGSNPNFPDLDVAAAVARIENCAWAAANPAHVAFKPTVVSNIVSKATLGVKPAKLGPLTMEGGGGKQVIGGGGKGLPADFTLTIGGGGKPQEVGPAPEEQPPAEGTPTWLVPALIGGGVLLAVVGVVAMKR